MHAQGCVRKYIFRIEVKCAFFQNAYVTELPVSEFLVNGKIRIRVWFSLDFYLEGKRDELPEDYHTCTASTCGKLSASYREMTSHGKVEMFHCVRGVSVHWGGRPDMRYVGKINNQCLEEKELKMMGQF